MNEAPKINLIKYNMEEKIHAFFLLVFCGLDKCSFSQCCDLIRLEKETIERLKNKKPKSQNEKPNRNRKNRNSQS